MDAAAASTTNASTQHNPAGRPRSEEAQKAIIKAALELLETTCYKNLSIEAIAEKAGVGKPTIYRRWKTKAALVADAFDCYSLKRMPAVDTGTFEGDLRVYLTNVADRIEYTIYGKVLRGLISEANLDEASGQAFVHFVNSRRAAMLEIVRRARARGEVTTPLQDDDLVDEINGAVIYRFLMRRLPLDQAFIHRHIDFILRAAKA